MNRRQTNQFEDVVWMGNEDDEGKWLAPKGNWLVYWNWCLNFSVVKVLMTFMRLSPRSSCLIEFNLRAIFGYVNSATEVAICRAKFYNSTAEWFCMSLFNLIQFNMTNHRRKEKIYELCIVTDPRHRDNKERLFEKVYERWKLSSSPWLQDLVDFDSVIRFAMNLWIRITVWPSNRHFFYWITSLWLRFLPFWRLVNKFQNIIATDGWLGSMELVTEITGTCYSPGKRIESCFTCSQLAALLINFQLSNRQL